MKRFLSEPLFHFFLIGAVIFTLFAVFDDTPPVLETHKITITPRDALRLAAEFEATWRRAPSAAELDKLIDGLVREEVYVREATALGLDQNDAVIRRRLHQKMEFLTEVGANSVAPDDSVLQAYLTENADRFAHPTSIAFKQILLKDDIDASEAREIARKLNLIGKASEAEKPSLLPNTFPASPPQVVEASFGAGFFDRLMKLAVGEWMGPVASAYGQHVVLVTNREDGFLPPLENIRDRVELDWRTNFAAKLREDRFHALRSQYNITLPDAEDLISK